MGRAVQAACGAFPSWRRTPVVERARVLFRLKALLDEHHDDLAVSLSREHGKNVAETWGEVQRGIENVEHAAGMPTLMMGDTLEDVARGVDCETVRQPIGVFAVITPYNFPVMIPLWFWPYAVAAGNTVVLKPSEQDPLTHQRVVELAVRAGLPPGVLNGGARPPGSGRGADRPSGCDGRVVRGVEPGGEDRVCACGGGGEAGAGAGGREEPHDRAAGRGPGDGG